MLIAWDKGIDIEIYKASNFSTILNGLNFRLACVRASNSVRLVVKQGGRPRPTRRRSMDGDFQKLVPKSLLRRPNVGLSDWLEGGGEIGEEWELTQTSLAPLESAIRDLGQSVTVSNWKAQLGYIHFLLIFCSTYSNNQQQNSRQPYQQHNRNRIRKWHSRNLAFLPSPLFREQTDVDVAILAIRLCEKIRCNFDLEEFRQGRERGMLDVTKGAGCKGMLWATLLDQFGGKISRN